MQADAQTLDAFVSAEPQPTETTSTPRSEAASTEPERRTATSAEPEVTSKPQASFARELLGEGSQESAENMLASVRRFGAALALSACYGLAIGTRSGGMSILRHAAAVPLAPLAVAALGVPALFIVLTLFDAPVEAPKAVSAAAKGAATTGLVLGGLSPAMALFVTTTSSHLGAAFCAGLGLIVAGAFGLRAFMGALGSALSNARPTVKTMSGFALAGFAIFATALSARVWWTTLPIFGGHP